jgi:DNA polymerase I-like protein with 3'-5' exonuclease and polymerase domains
MIDFKIEKGLPPEAYLGEMVSLDLEIFGMDKERLHRPGGTFACLSVAMEHQLDYHNGLPEITVWQFTDEHDVAECLRRLEKGKWIFTNATFDLRQLRRWATIPPRRIWDTMLVEQELFGGYYSSFGLAAQAQRWLGLAMEKETRDEFSDGNEMTPEMQRYAALDPLVSLMVAQCQIDYICEEGEAEDFNKYYWGATAPMIWVVLDMPPAHVDVAAWSSFANEMRSKADLLKAGLPFNPASPKQVKEWIEEKTRRKVKSTDEEHILELVDELSGKGAKWAEVVDTLTRKLDYMHLAKNAGTYGTSWLEQSVENGNEVWANWKICGATDTSRLSCDMPNLTNIPARKYPIFRTFFVPQQGHEIVVADVASQEPRILAKLSNDQTLIEALRRGESPHVTTGRLIFDDPNFSKKDERYTIAKSINLGIPYGMSAKGVAAKAGIEEDLAERYLKIYFQKFPGVKGYMSEYRQFAQRHGFVRNLLGRKCWMNPYSYQWQNNAINCLDAETEALTQRGWVKGFDLQETDRLLTKNAETGCLVWQPMTGLHLYPDYEGPVVEFRHRDFSAVTTPNHRWLVTTRFGRDDKTKVQVKTSAEINPNGMDAIHRAGFYLPMWSALTPDQAELLGWFVTDGYLRQPYPNPKRKDHRWGPKAHILQSQRGNPDKVARIDALIARLGTATRSVSKEGTFVIWRLSDELSRFLYSLAPNRVLTVPTLLQLDYPCLVRLREAMLLADGSVSKGRARFTAGTKEKADMFQVVISLTGDTSTCTYRDIRGYVSPKSAKMENQPKGKGVWLVSVCNRQVSQITRNQRTEYIGKVPMWCPTVPNSFFVARRDGKVFITGNSPIQSTAGHQIKIAAVNVWRKAQELGIPFCLTMLVHDEHVLDVPKELVETYIQIEEEAWAEAGRATLGDTIPVVVEAAHGDSWACKK